MEKGHGGRYIEKIKVAQISFPIIMIVLFNQCYGNSLEDMEAGLERWYIKKNYWTNNLFLSALRLN